MWHSEASSAFWKRTSKSDMALDKVPRVGKSYQVIIEKGDVNLGDLVDLSYLPPAVFYAGFETIDDLSGLRIVRGQILEVVAHRTKDGFTGLEFVEARLCVIDASGLDDFAKLEVQANDNHDLWTGFLSDATFKNVLKIGDFISMRWANDSHVGEELLLERHHDTYNVLYRHGWQTGSYKKICAGRVRVPTALSAKLDHRLSRMESDKHWYGRTW